MKGPAYRVNATTILGPSYGIMGDELRICRFPFLFDNAVYSGCTTAKRGFYWCATVADIDSSADWWGRCTKAAAAPQTADVIGVDEYSLEMDASICYDKREGAMATETMYYGQLKTLQLCLMQCDSVRECKGINYQRLENNCYISIGDSFEPNITSDGMDAYTRRNCTGYYSHTHTHTPTHIHQHTTPTHIYQYTHTPTNIHQYTHTHTHIHQHTHARTRARANNV